MAFCPIVYMLVQRPYVLTRYNSKPLMARCDEVSGRYATGETIEKFELDRGVMDRHSQQFPDRRHY